MKYRYLIVSRDSVTGTNDESLAVEANEYEYVVDCKTGLSLDGDAVPEEGAVPEEEDDSEDDSDEE